MNKVARVEVALRIERDMLRSEGNVGIANAINTYLQNADDQSKTRLFDIIMCPATAEPVGDLIQPSFSMSVNWEYVANAWIGVIEGPYSPWIGSVEINRMCDPIDNGIKDEFKPNDSVWYSNPSFWETDCRMKVNYDDPDDDDEGDASAVKVVGKDDIIAGLQKMAEKSPSHFADMISENDDAITHDVFAQYVILGEIIYG